MIVYGILRPRRLHIGLNYPGVEVVLPLAGPAYRGAGRATDRRSGASDRHR